MEEQNETSTASAPETTVAAEPVAQDNTYVGDSHQDTGGRPGQDATTAPAKAGDATGQSATKNWEEEYKNAQKASQLLEKNYAELRRKLVSQGTERNQFQGQVEALTNQVKQLGEALAKATETPYDPDQWMNTLKTQGPKAIEAEFQRLMQSKDQAYNEKISGMESKLRARDVKAEVTERQGNAKDFPNFKELEPEMMKIMEGLREDFKAGVLQVDPDTVDVPELIDHLYTLARAKHIPDALKAAEEAGKAQATQELAREAQSGVAGGGKHTSTQAPNLDKMSIEEERAYWVKQLGEETYR